MKKIVLFTCFLFISSYSFVLAQNWNGFTSQQPKEANIDLIESDVYKTQINFNLEGYLSESVETPDGVQTIIRTLNGTQITEKGMPDLGKLHTSVVIPDAENMNIKVIAKEFIDIEGIDIAPSKGHFTRDINPEDVPYEYAEVYRKDAFWPNELAQLEDPFIIRDFRGQTVTVFPFQYNPVSKTLRVFTSLTVVLESNGEIADNPLIRDKNEIRADSEFSNIYNNMFLNMNAAEKNYQFLEGEEGSLLIIAHDDFVDAMKPFVDWKRTTGRKTELLAKSEVGSSASEIKSFVVDYYNENEDFAHLLLVGDGPQLEPMTTSNGHSDNAYGYITGNDSYNEIFVGRFSAENVEQVETQVQRMIEYERDMTTEDTWLSTGLGIARNEGAGNGHNGEADYEHMDFIRDTLLNFTYDVVHKRYDGGVPGVPNTTATDISNDINEGVSTINFINHGSVTGWSVAGYSISHVNQLTNTGKLPFIWSVACVNGNFVNNYSFAESWMRATHDGEPTGAVGTLMSTINQPWQPPMEGQDEMVALLTEQSIVGYEMIKRTYGGLSANGSMAMIPAYDNQGVLTHDTWVLFGDPTLMVRTDVPQELVVDYNPVILMGTNSFEVMAENAEDATVALTRYDEVEEEVVIVGRAYISEGVATVDFDEEITQPQNLTLTITAFNKVTYINEEIEVIPPDGPYVLLDSFTPNNESELFIYGQNTGIDVTLKNVGVENAENVTATITIDDPYFSLTDDNPVDFGTVNSGDQDNTATVANAFTFAVAEDIPNNHSATALLQVTDGNETWESTMRLSGAAPEMVFETLWIEDDGQLNPGVLDPGETADLHIVVTNTGQAVSQNTEISAESESQWLSFTQNNYQLSAIEPLASDTATFVFSASAQSPAESPALIDFEMQSGEYTTQETREIIIGQAPVYSDGNIPTTYNPSPNTQSNAQEPGIMTVTIPEGAIITGVDTEYSMTSENSAWMSEQRSFIRCVSEGGTTESSVSSGSNSSGGTFDYSRNDLTIANDVTGGGDITFELHAFRTWGGSGSNEDYTFVENNSWKIIIHYELPGYDVTFTVEDTYGDPVEGASITLNGFTYPEGQYVIPSVVDGAYEYSVSKYAYTSDSGNFDVDGEELTINAVLEALPTYEAEFTVEDTEGEPLTDASVTINDYTYEPGQYDIDSLVAGEYQFEVSLDGYQSASGEFEITDDNVTVAAQLQELFSLTFQISDGTQALQNAVITVNGNTHSAGVYTLTELLPGTYDYVISKNEHFDAEGQVIISNADVTESVTLTPWPRYHVTFNVEDVYGNTVDDAKILIDNNSLAEGTYTSEGLFAGDYSYRVEKDGYLSVEGDFELVDEDIEIGVALQDIYNVSFNITNEYGEVSDAVITINDDTYDPGVMMFEQMLPGTYTYKIHKEDFYEVEGTMELVDDHMEIDVFLIEIKLEALFDVQDEFGNQVDDAVVVMEGSEYEPGNYLMIGLDNGLYNYIVKREGYHDNEGSIFLMGENVTVDIVLKATGLNVNDLNSNDLSVYPNPFSSMLTIDVSEESPSEVYILDVLGNTVFSAHDIRGVQVLDLDHLPKGNYFIKTVTENTTLTRKITKMD